MIPRHAVLLGLGLMGGSLGLALRALDPSIRVSGYDADPDAAREALRRGAITDRLDLPTSLPADCDVTVLAVPPRAAAALLTRVASALPAGAVVIDLSSVMLPSLAAALAIPDVADRFVPAHPLAGAERSGIGAAREDLYDGAVVLVGRPLDPSGPAGRVAALWSALRARPAAIVPALHDALVALTSHLPYAASIALVRTLRRTGTMTRSLAEAAGPGLRDTTRIAASAPELWAEILAINAPKLVPALELLEREVRGLRRAIEEGGPALRDLLEEARAFRREIAP